MIHLYKTTTIHLTEAEVAALLKSTDIKESPSITDIVALVSNKPSNLFSEIVAQRHRFEKDRIAELQIRDLSGAEIAGDFFASLFPDPKRAKLGIMELLINAIEHGNLEISFQEKNALLRDNMWLDEINTRLKSSKFMHRNVHIHCYRHNLCTEISIRDEGSGFDWGPYMKTDFNAPTTLTGRGIACADKISFDEMRYVGNGNIVKARQYNI